MIHEIQHAIQSIEGFEEGYTTKLSKLDYFKRLGEIEADDTKRRYILEKGGKLDRNIVEPESSKDNPQHSKLNNYLKNRKLIDKIKDSIYNYFNNKDQKGGDNYEIYQDDVEQINNEKIGKNEEKNNSDSNIQESENNSGSFSFDKNAKRYEDLESANIVKFNKKTDGTINIEISNNNELINQFTVTSKENASKQLGNNIANYIYDNATETSKTINLKQTETAKVQNSRGEIKSFIFSFKQHCTKSKQCDQFRASIKNEI